MEFISCEDKPIREPITWPNMCVWCLGAPTKTYEVRGKGIFGRTGQRRKLKLECPICGEHYFWLRGLQISPFVFWGGWVLFGLFGGRLLGPMWIFYLFSNWIYFPLLLIGAVLSLIRYLIEPVRISEEKGWYSITIRNERYAREFAVLNNLNDPSPIPKPMPIEQGPKERLETLRLEYNALAEKIFSTKSKEEKAKIRAERDRIAKEMNLLESL